VYNALLKKYQKLIELINTYQLKNHSFKIKKDLKVLDIQLNGHSQVALLDAFLKQESSKNERIDCNK